MAGVVTLTSCDDPEARNLSARTQGAKYLIAIKGQNQLFHSQLSLQHCVKFPKMSRDSRPGVGLAQFLQQQFKRFGSDVAIEHGAYRVTFTEVHKKASILAAQLRKHEVRKEEPIVILANRGIDHIISQVAVVYAGCSCVPLDVDLPDEHLLKFLTGCSIVFTDPANQTRLPTLHHVIVDHTGISMDIGLNQIEVSKSGRECCSHIMYTSGSTGKPKGVQVLADSLINLVFNHFAPVKRGSRVGHVCNVGFDVSLWEIWSVLLVGGTSVVFERHEILDPLIFERRMKSDRIDVMWQTTSLLATIAHVCPNIYSCVDTLLTGGEAINVHTIRTIFENGPPRRLLNVYGPTETTIFTTYHEICQYDVDSGHIPIGKGLQNYDTWVVDENLQPVPCGSIGELLVGGKGVSPGYYRQPEKTSQVFVCAPHLLKNGQIKETRLYRTGDLVRETDTGDLYYLGRRDHEVKIRGQRVDLESVEESLLETQLLSSAVALRVMLEEPAGGSILVAYVVPITPEITTDMIRAAYIALGPQLMVPRLQLTEIIPLTPSGKVDRKRLINDYVRHLQPLRNGASDIQTNGDTSLEEYLKHWWRELLGCSSTNFNGSDNFFSLGGTSLQAVLLASSIKQSLGVLIPVAALFDNPTLQEMSDLITQARNGEPSQHENLAKAMPWLDDCKLGQELELSGTSYPDWTSRKEGKVFLTGATGFIGAFFLLDILALPNVQKVACLVRASDSATALVRIRNILERYKLVLSPEEEAKIIPVAGDFAVPKLGLDDKEYERLSMWASVVFHLGAHVNFVQPYSSHRAANTLGTVSMIQFANSGRLKALHYTSTISAYGPTGMVTGSTEIPEIERPASHVDAVRYDTGYAQSQFVAESIIWDAVDKGFPITVYRLGYVLGHSETGAMNLEDFISRLMTSSIRSGCYPLLPGHRKDLVPVDFVVSALLRLSSHAGYAGHAFNLVHPDRDSAMDLPLIFEAINQLAGERRLVGVQYSQWLENLAKVPDCPLLSLMPMLVERVWREMSRWEMQQDLPTFSTENTRQALATLAPELLLCPSTSSVVARYCPEWIIAAAA
ncbi:acetyl-CoA synthetase-like protein [Aspergillus affinis]|uniref:acetyl-CoA synthetase-like protein n=1 Tax=Aspergillus affinis TaxID=1070780 RepID=UPI0022FE786A|nr:acetyl-CoA synthetase-like protein [Aspergillus affinis]KAI9036020.1 acetyl-CoA synthetase-like protein [Aspergillus affinis]